MVASETGGPTSSLDTCWKGTLAFETVAARSQEAEGRGGGDAVREVAPGCVARETAQLGAQFFGQGRVRLRASSEVACSGTANTQNQGDAFCKDKCVDRELAHCMSSGC